MTLNYTSPHDTQTLAKNAKSSYFIKPLKSNWYTSAFLVGLNLINDDALVTFCCLIPYFSVELTSQTCQKF